MKGSTSSSLLRQAIAWDDESWRELVRRYTKQIYSDCRRMGLPPNEAADVTQEVFQAVLVSLKQFRRDREGDGFRKWLHAITRHKISDHLRKQYRQRPAQGGSTAYIRLLEHHVPPVVDEPNTLELDDAELLRSSLAAIKGDFEPRTWNAFWRTAVDEQKSNDVADELQMTSQAVRKAKSRVLARLREEIQSHYSHASE